MWININEQVDESARMLAGAQEKLLDRYDAVYEFFQHVSMSLQGRSQKVLWGL